MQGSKELIVHDNQDAQRSCVYLNFKTMDEICLDYGEVVLIKNERNGREFAYVALPEGDVPKRGIGIHSSLRSLLYLRLGDKVTIKAAPSMWYWKNTNIQPVGDSNVRYNAFEGDSKWLTRQKEHSGVNVNKQSASTNKKKSISFTSSTSCYFS